MDLPTIGAEDVPHASPQDPSTALPPPSPLSSILSDSPLPPNTNLAVQSSQGLRKSVSVDSFQYVRDSVSPPTTRPSRVNTSSALDPPRGLIFGMSAGLKRERQELAQSGRARGISVSSARDELQSPISISDSDVERSDSLASPIDPTYPRVSLKGQDLSRPFIKAGELPLPSRTPTLSTTSSVSSGISTSATSNTQDAVPRIQSTSSLHSVARRGVSMAPAGRTRSGSLGVYAPSSSRRMMINTAGPTDSSQRQEPPVTLIVVGVSGSGKSIVIRKGLKGCGLSDPSASLPGLSPSLRYSRRTGRISDHENLPNCALNIIEVDITDPETEITTVTFLPETPSVDGVIICYDASDESSFQPVEGLLRGYRQIQTPTIVLACKSDVERRLDPQASLEVLQQYDVGLVEVTNANDAGREKMRRSFHWLFKAVFRDRRTARNELDDYRNPASPDLLKTSPWEGSRTATPTASSSAASMAHQRVHSSVSRASHVPPISAPRAPGTPTSPTRVRSTGDLLAEGGMRSREWHAEGENAGMRPVNKLPRSSSAESLRNPPADSERLNGSSDEKKETKEKEPRPAQWATIDELLDKLMFLSVSGDDPTYITHFLLTYRRFASPRSVLLAMQKRMRQLDSPTGDPMFACFAQMRICHLLEIWIRDYPYDFAVRGTAGALSALIKSIISKTYLLHYGSDFLPFLELLPSLVDRDAPWALKVEDVTDESDDSYSLLEEDDESLHKSESNPSIHRLSSKAKHVSSPVARRERKGSIPTKALLPSSSSTVNSTSAESIEYTPRQQLKELQRVAQEINTLPPDAIAQEITRMEVQFFLDIEPRHWLQYTFVSGRKDPETDSITRFNNLSNHLAAWVVSLILCHDRPKMRARQIEKFVEIAQRLRSLNNYSALRAVVAGINSSTFSGEPTMELFKAKTPELAKVLQSWDVLLQHIRSHRAYRMALRNTKGACIPALEVHMSDLIRSHEGNPDFLATDPSKIHWGKFNMMGRFISSTTQCQAQCRNTNDYNFAENIEIGKLLLSHAVMNDEMQTSRMALNEGEVDELRNTHPPISRPLIRESQGGGQPRDVAILRRLFFW